MENKILIMVIWKNIKCPSCGKPNDREDLKARKGVCINCGFAIVSNLSTYILNNKIKIEAPTP